MFAVTYQPDAGDEVRAIRAYDRVRILEEIGKQRTTRPHIVEGNKKRIEIGDGTVVFQLRVGAYRVFYDVDTEALRVIVRHVRRKGRRTTGEIL